MPALGHHLGPVPCSAAKNLALWAGGRVHAQFRLSTPRRGHPDAQAVMAQRRRSGRPTRSANAEEQFPVARDAPQSLAPLAGPPAPSQSFCRISTSRPHFFSFYGTYFYSKQKGLANRQPLVLD